MEANFMGRNSGRRAKFSQLFPTLTKRLGAWPVRVLTGTVALLVAGMLPAQAEVLEDWQYDAQTRSLTLTLPDSVVPLVSVVAPDQLVLELPNTQVGNVMGQSVRDGLVESIVLEQATPETVWVVMDFAAGTVLSASQSATPIAETADGDQQWQVRPTLIAASRRAASQTVSSANIPNETGRASSLETPAAEVAQTPDFSNLPVLEPSVPIDQPVSVPPLVEPTAGALPRPVTSAPVPAPLPQAESTPVFDVEVIPAEEPVVTESTEEPIATESTEEPVATEPEPVESVETARNRPVPSAATQSVPDEPPFLGSLEGESQTLPTDSPADAISSQPVPAEPLPVEPLPVATQSVPDARIASGTESVEPTIEEAADATAEEVRPANVSRWPEPIPFGQPLPK